MFSIFKYISLTPEHSVWAATFIEAGLSPSEYEGVLTNFWYSNEAETILEVHFTDEKPVRGGIYA